VTQPSDPPDPADAVDRANSLKGVIRKTLAFIRRHVPPGVRLLLGLVLIVGGVFGFLPVLGFWMIPLGIAVAAMDITPIWRYFIGK